MYLIHGKTNMADYLYILLKILLIDWAKWSFTYNFEGSASEKTKIKSLSVVSSFGCPSIIIITTIDELRERIVIKLCVVQRTFDVCEDFLFKIILKLK